MSGTALEQLRYALRRLHRRSGEPSYRVVAQRTGKVVSHTTVGSVLRCESPPGWGPLELVVEVLGGDLEEFRTLWIAVRDEASPLELPRPVAWSEEADEPARSADVSLPDLDAEEEDLQERADSRSRREGETRKELLLALEARADATDRLHELYEQLGRERGRNEQLRQRVAELEAELKEHSRRIEQLQDTLQAVRDERLGVLHELNWLHARRAELYFTWARQEERGRQDAEAGRRERGREVRELRERLAAAEELLRSVLAARAEEGAEGNEPGGASGSELHDGPWYRLRRRG